MGELRTPSQPPGGRRAVWRLPPTALGLAMRTCRLCQVHRGARLETGLTQSFKSLPPPPSYACGSRTVSGGPGPLGWETVVLLSAALQARERRSSDPTLSASCPADK